MPNEPPEPSTSKGATLFLSYSHVDEAQARRLAAALEQAGYTIWWDELIEGGAAYAQSIGSALATADAIIVLWSKTSVDSDWVRDEAAQARDRHRLIPLSIDGTRPPLGFGQYQVIKLRRWRGRRDTPEFAAIERAIAIACGAPAPPAKIRPPRVSRRTALFAGVGAVAAVIGGGAFFAIDRGILGGEPDQPSIAVLPFKNLSGDPSQSYFSEGLTEEVRGALVRLKELQVLAATSSARAHDENDDMQSIAKQLDVGYLLGGSVRKSGDVFRIATELTDGKTGFSLWSTTVDRPLNDIFALQGEIARMVAKALSIQIGTDEPVPGGTRNVEAYDHYLKGKSLYHLAKDEASDRQALAHYDLAIAADPKFAMAYAARSRVLSSLAVAHAKANELKSLNAAAIAEAKRAVALAPTLAEGHLALGYALFSGRLDVRGARPSYERAYHYGRGDADIVLLYALYAVRARRFAEARTAIEDALALDPLNPRTHRAAGTIAYASRRYADAVAQYRRAIELNPSISNAHALMGDALMELGRLEEARAAYAAEPSAMFRLRGQAVLEHRTGNRAAAKQAFDRLVKEVGDAALYQQAEVMAQWGETEVALAKLERARAVGDSGLSLIATDPLLDPIAKNPKFLNIVRELGFA